MIYLICWLLPTAAANWAAVETLHHGSIFDNPRAWLQARGGFINDLVSCPFCLSHWTAMALTASVFAVLVTDWKYGALAPVYWLAVVRGSNLCNDYFHDKCRTPRLGRDMIDSLTTLAEVQNDGTAETK